MQRFTISELQNGYKAKEFSPVEITGQFIQRILAEDGKYNSYITICEEKALAQAKIIERKLMSGEELGILHGIPISLKDNIATKGIRTTNGSAIDKDYIPESNATVVQQLTLNDAITLGKTNLHEYAFGITSNNPHYGAVRNPWNTEYTSGGSSGGAGAAVAANLCVAGLGTDTGGSVRIPAASCGVIGLKPTYGLVKTKGVTNIAWTLDHVGPITSNMEDLAYLLQALTQTSYHQYFNRDVRGLRIGVPKQYFNEQIDSEIDELYQRSLKELEKLGCILIDLELPDISMNAGVGFIIALSEAGLVHKERIETSIDKYGADVKQQMQATSSISAVQYLHALENKEKMKQSFEKVFLDVDLIVTPTLPATPQKVGVDEVKFGEVTEPIFNCMVRYAFVFNLVGFPALSIPCGLTKAKLPVGIQMVSAHFREDLLLRTGYAYEQSYLTEFYTGRDKVCCGETTKR